MACIRISHWVSCVRQYAYSNDQGGKHIEGNDVLITFPIAFQRKVLGIQATKGLGVNAPSYKDVTLRNFKLYSHDNRGYHTTWLAIGV